MNQPAPETRFDVCEVHQYAYNDTTKRAVQYCPTCKAWICEQCRAKPVARAVAATNRFINIIFNLNP